MATARAKQSVEYFFCRNTECNVHASFLVGQVPPDSKLKVGETCPICNVGKIDRILIESVATVPRGVGNAPTATVLPGLPYGGLVLQRDDKDSSQTWGGTAISDPRHDGAQYVAELQRDLLRLGYYGPARGGETVGAFGLQLMACVLDFKRHLVVHYRIPGNADFTQVQAGATSTNAAVHFPPQGLVSPAEALRDVRAWAAHFGRTRNDVPVLRALNSWANEWEKLRVLGAPTLADLPALRQQAKSDADLAKQLTDRQRAAGQASTRFGTKMARLEQPRRQGSLTEAAVADAETSFDDLLAAIAAVGEPIPDLLGRVRALDDRLPGKSQLNDPGDRPVTIPNPPPATGLDARFDRMQQVRSGEQRVRNDQSAALNFARGKLSTFKPRLDQLGKRLNAHDTAGSVLASSLELARIQIESAASAAQLLNAVPPSGPKNVSAELREARQLPAEWLKSSTSTPPDPAGALEQLATAIAGFEAKWATASVPTPDPVWSSVKQTLTLIGSRLRTYRGEIDNPNAEQWEGAYLALLRDFGRVDHATARHIRGMVTQGELNGQKVFLTPMDDEIVQLSGTLASVLPRILDQELVALGRTAGDGPLPIVRFIYAHESGANHSKAYGGRKFVTLGIDWPNSKTSNAFFDEKLTPGRTLSTSRGWGATQFTFFETGQPPDLKDDTGRVVRFTLHAGIPFSDHDKTRRPLPLAIQSAEENFASGTRLYLRGFQAPRRECTFEPSGAPQSRRSHDCTNCAKRLRTGPFKQTGGGVKTFDDAQGDFERTNSRTGPLYRMRDIARLRELLASGFFNLPDGRTGDEVREADLDEFPCSWLAAIIRYSGVSRRGFDYMLEAVDTMAK